MPRLRERRYRSLITKLSEFHKQLSLDTSSRVPIVGTIRSQSDGDGFVTLDEDIVNCGDTDQEKRTGSGKLNTVGREPHFS